MEHFTQNKNREILVTFLIPTFLPPACLVPTISFHTSYKSIYISLNQFFSFMNFGKYISFWRRKWKEVLPNWPKLLHVLFLDQLSYCLHSPSLTLQLPTSNPQGMIIDKLFSQQATKNISNNIQEFNGKILSPE